mgnify:CR=1 FL=1
MSLFQNKSEAIRETIRNCSISTLPQISVKDLPQNPLIDPPRGNVIADPQVLIPGEYDNKWHLFATGSGHFYHFISNNGIQWRLIDEYSWRAGTCFLFYWKEEWILYYAYYKGNREKEVYIVARTTLDFKRWSKPITILKPEFSWEREGPIPEVRNPCLICKNNKFWLYYSGGTVFLEDAGYEEPKYIGLAFANNPFGPFKKLKRPIIVPKNSDNYRNLGAGAIKVYRYRDYYIGFNNGIYIGVDGKSHSAILLVVSYDGLRWHDAPYNPIIKPTVGWKRAFVYQLDAKFLRTSEGKIKILLYYNARDGWKNGIERIGCSILESENSGK